MRFPLYLRLSDHCRKYALSYLACSWISGLILGTSAANGLALDAASYQLLLQDRTLIQLLSVILLPVFVSVLVISTNHPIGLLPIVFLKSFCFAYTSRLLTQDFNTAGWLIQILTMFSDCASLPILWLFWHRLFP